MKGSVLITGGAGYVGCHTVINLVKAKFSVIVIDNLSNTFSYHETPESIKRVEELTGEKIPFYNCNICDRNDLEKVFKNHRIHSVIHCAAIKGLESSLSMPLTFYQINVIGTLNVLELMSENGIRNLVFCSSVSVYGMPQFLPLTEDHPTGNNCTSPYAKSKFMVEEILKDLCTSDPLWKIIILRFFNPIGAHESGILGEDAIMKPFNLMPNICKVATGKKAALKVYGDAYRTIDGTCIRDFVHIMDVANAQQKALEKILFYPFKGWIACNICSGRGYTVFEMIATFVKVSGRNIDLLVVDRRKYDPPIVLGDMDSAHKNLNWFPSLDIDDMCRDAWKWVTMNPNGYGRTSAVELDVVSL